MEAVKVLETIQQECMSPERSVRFVRTIEVGQAAVRQGDIYLWRIESVPAGATKRPAHDRQIALGASVGSRHCIDAGAEVYDLPERMRHALLGPVLRLQGRTVGTHPEHAHYSLPPGIYQVGYQLDPRTRQAVRD